MPEFGVELEVGRTAGLSPYLRNEVFVEVDRASTDEQGEFLLTPFLADRPTGNGFAAEVRLVADRVAAGVSLRTFPQDAWRIHHRGVQKLSQRRLRSDSSVDDSGVDYVELDPPLDRDASQTEASTLFEVGFGAEYRYVWTGPAVDLFIPMGGRLMLMHDSRRPGLNRIGLQAHGGAGVALRLLPTTSLMLIGRVHAGATGHYGRRPDAARRAVEVDESTEAALFSTLLSASINVGVQFRIR